VQVQQEVWTMNPEPRRYKIRASSLSPAPGDKGYIPLEKLFSGDWTFNDALPEPVFGTEAEQNEVSEAV
jgi:hypothetical protein